MMRRFYFWLRDTYLIDVTPSGLPSHMDFGPEAPSLEKKRVEIRRWMKVKGIGHKPVERITEIQNDG